MLSMIPFRYKCIPVFLPVILGILLISACAPTGQSQEPATEQGQDTVPASWSALLNISGGFAGLMREISIDQSGQVVLVDKKRKSQFEKQVTPQELQNIAELLTLLPVDTPSDQRSSQCRDCITYRLVTTVNGKKRQMVTDDAKLRDSDAKDLIRVMTTLASGMMKQK